MKNIFIIASKEFRSYLSSPMAYIITAIFLVGTGFFFSFSDLTYSETSLRGFLGNPFYIPIILLLIAVLTMRLLAEERKMGTIELLLTAPVRDSEIIMGKFFGVLGVIALMLILTFYYPLILTIFGDPDIGPMISGYLGLFLLSASCLAIGLFSSSLTSNQIVAAVLAGGILLGLWYLGSASSYLPKTVGDVINYFSLSNYFPSFVTGVIDTRGIIYYISVTALFLFLAMRSLENSRWN